jgi:tetratricopeptide (TPR) repeat protein
MRETLAEAYTEAAQLYRAKGNPAEAARLWERAAALDPRNPTCRMHLSNAYQQLGRDADALVVLEELAALMPGNPICYLNIGVVHARAQRFAEAESAFREVVRVAPQQALGYVQLARLYMVAGREPAEALRCAREAVRLESNASNYAMLGAAYEVNGDPTRALEAVERAMQLEPENPEYRQIHAQLRTRR